MSTEQHLCEECGDSFNTPPKFAAHKRGHQQEISEGDLVEELRRLTQELGKPPGRRDMDNLGEYASSTYSGHFGSWNGALERAGVGINEEGTNSEDALLKEICQLEEKLGRPPTSKDMKSGGKHCPKSYAQQFGSWNKALEAAGFDIHSTYDNSREELEKNLRIVADKIGRAPTTNEFQEFGEYGYPCYFSRYGSWEEALKSAGLDPTTREFQIPEGTDEYGPGWTDAKKKTVRERDGFICQDPGCEMTQQQHKAAYGKSLHVHHLRRPDAFERREKANVKDNLVTFCCVCHTKWEQMRPLRPDPR